MRHSLVLAAVLALACGPNEALVVVHVNAQPPLGAVSSFDVDVTVGSSTRTFSVPLAHAPVAIPPTRTFGVIVPAGLGPRVDISVAARGLSPGALAAGSASASIVARGRTDIEVLLGAAPADGGADGPVTPRPRLIAPMSTSRVASRRPQLTFTLPAGASNPVVDLCATRDCAAPFGQAGVSGNTASPAADLPPGAVFWRVRAQGTLGEVASATWQLHLGRAPGRPDHIVGYANDMNGDGLSDLATIDQYMPMVDGGAFVAMSNVFVYHGIPRASGAPLPLVRPAPAGRFVANAQDQHLSCIAAAGDLNGDGYGDLLVGQEQYAQYIGQMFVYFGGPTGIHTQADQSIVGDITARSSFGRSCTGVGDLDGDGYGDAVILTGNPATLVIYRGGPGGLELSAPVRVTFPSTLSYASQVIPLGDVNGDGRPDLAVSSPYESGGGAVYYFPGKANGMLDVPVRMTGVAGGFEFGYSLAGGGDVNGDGYADLIVGENNFGSPLHAYVFLGGAAGLPAAASVTWTGPASTNYSWAVATGGDVDADGFDDVLVTEELYGLAPGGFHVRFGASTGLSMAREVFRSGEPGEYLGTAARMGDFDGDGHADIVVSAYAYNSSAGRVDLWRGGTTLSMGPDQIIDPGLPMNAMFGYVLASAAEPRVSGRARRLGGGF